MRITYVTSFDRDGARTSSSTLFVGVPVAATLNGLRPPMNDVAPSQRPHSSQLTARISADRRPTYCLT